MLVVGVDVGNTKTLAISATLDGRIVGVGRAPGGNHQSVGVDGFRGAVAQAVDGTGADPGEVAAVHVGAAGADWPEDVRALRAALEPLYGPVALENDALLGLHAGTSEGWGGVVVGGSGSNAAARAPDGRTLFVGGQHWWTGEWGGASLLGQEAIRLALRSWQGRGEATALADLVLEESGLGDMESLFRAVTELKGPDPIAVAPLVTRAARQKDGPACRLLAAFGREMGLSVGVALRRLGLADSSPPVVALGGLVRMAEATPLLAALDEELHRQAPSARLTVLEAEPVVGAVVAALRTVGVEHRHLAAALHAQWRARQTDPE